MSKKTSNYYLGVARKNGFRIAEGGCHTKIFAPGQSRPIVIPRHHDLSPGVEHAIIKWFVRLGVLLAFMMAACYLTAYLAASV